MVIRQYKVNINELQRVQRCCIAFNGTSSSSLIPPCFNRVIGQLYLIISKFKCDNSISSNCPHCISCDYKDKDICIYVNYAVQCKSCDSQDILKELKKFYPYCTLCPGLDYNSNQVCGYQREGVLHSQTNANNMSSITPKSVNTSIKNNTLHNTALILNSEQHNLKKIRFSTTNSSLYEETSTIYYPVETNINNTIKIKHTFAEDKSSKNSQNLKHVMSSDKNIETILKILPSAISRSTTSNSVLNNSSSYMKKYLTINSKNNIVRKPITTSRYNGNLFLESKKIRISHSSSYEHSNSFLKSSVIMIKYRSDSSSYTRDNWNIFDISRYMDTHLSYITTSRLNKLKITESYHYKYKITSHLKTSINLESENNIDISKIKDNIIYQSVPQIQYTSSIASYKSKTLSNEYDYTSRVSNSYIKHNNTTDNSTNNFFNLKEIIINNLTMNISSFIIIKKPNYYTDKINIPKYMFFIITTILCSIIATLLIIRTYINRRKVINNKN